MDGWMDEWVDDGLTGCDRWINEGWVDDGMMDGWMKTHGSLGT